jgi:hypothetical protein
MEAFFMEPSINKKKKWIVFGVVIAVLAVLVAVGPVLVTKHMKSSQKPPVVEFMIKVKGTIQKQVADTSNKTDIIYLKGDNGLYYILVGNKLSNLSANIGKSVTVFGNIMVPEGPEDIKVNGKPVRMRIGVEKFDLA